MANHALLSASSSHRWLECPPSAQLCATQEDRASPYAMQGTDAHSLCEYKVLHALGQKATDPTENLDLYDMEMEACTNDYCNFVLEQLKEAKNFCQDPLVLVEQKLDFSKWVPEGFGTGDCLVIADNVLHVIDFKYGVGVLVDSNNNPQMQCYGLGALELFDGIYDIEVIRMTIFQPRRNHISTFEMTKQELLEWADNVLAPTAKLAYAGLGSYKAGDHCKFCKVKTICKEYARLSSAYEDFINE